MRHLPRIPTALLSLLLVASLQSSEAADEDHSTNMAASMKLFQEEVREILLQNCIKCHGGEKTKSGYNLATRNGLLSEGDIGVAVVVGDSKQSPLLDYLSHREEPHMPPKKPQLAAEKIAAIAKWIDLGAAYDKPLVEQSETDVDKPMQVTEQDRQYWAFAPLKKDFPANADIDHFIDSRRVEKKLGHAPEAPKRTLIRRLYLDLTGLPPEPEEIDGFLSDHSPDAYEKLVDRLLASPRFGERWARHWLDVARFAESHGFEHDYDRKFAYHFRDFVIRAFNQDMPFDQFVRWQLAGDELAPDDPLALMATGFLGAGVYPTQITINEAERIRYDAMDDMLATTGSAMLATTVGCARCHDHKYDPIPARDYYQMLSAFTTTVRSDVDLDLGLLDRRSDDGYADKLAILEEKLAEYESKGLPIAFRSWLDSRAKGGEDRIPASQWTVLKANSLSGTGGVVFQEQPDGSHLATGPNPVKATYTFKATSPVSGATAIRLEALSDPSMVRGGPGRAGNGNIQLTGITVSVGGGNLDLHNPRATFEQNKGNLSIASSIDGNGGTGWALDPQFGKNHAAIFDIADPALVKAGSEFVIILDFQGNTSHTIGRPRLSLSTAPAAGLKFEGAEDPRVTAAREIDRLLQAPVRESDPARDQKILDTFKVLDPDYQKLVAEIGAHKATRKKQVQKVMVCSEGPHFKPMRHHTSSGSIPDFYKESHILERGDPEQKQEVASLGFLQVLTRSENTGEWMNGGSKDRRTSGRRAALSQWITDTGNGAGHLLARVIVNRLWQHHFGRGIVATPNDFGFQGERPTHPELLDWLASELISSGWKLKPIHKLMVMSKAYRMGSMESEVNRGIDPENKFLWHRPPMRLEAEAIRDSALAVGGLLDTTMYGPGTLDEGTPRRSIYFMVKRSKLVPTMQLFDWPDSLTSLGRRAVTTTPSQALVFINDPNFRRMAEGFAKRISAKDEPIDFAYLIAFGRQPDAEEERLASEFLENQVKSYGGDRNKALADFCAAIMSASEFIYIE